MAGLITAVDASVGTITVQDLLSKKTVLVNITAESQLHKLAPEIAQRIAMRLKGSMPPGTPGTAAPSTSGSAGPGAGAPSGSAAGGGYGNGGAGMGAGMRQGGAPDFSQMVNRAPVTTLAELKKGDAVLIVATQGTASEGGTVITLLGGVEAILQAAPSGSQAAMLSPWNLGGAPSGDAQ